MLRRKENMMWENDRKGNVSGRWLRESLDSSALTFKGIKIWSALNRKFNPISQKLLQKVWACLYIGLKHYRKRGNYLQSIIDGPEAVGKFILPKALSRVFGRG
ncbi:hypothetical protein V8G54_024096 [Vigna mungo]|uniref:Uncharacterized protein n=1 Tax=Vigna mungo TaxID=3915 RepID=A0AAQ3N5U3_VIGMU